MYKNIFLPYAYFHVLTIPQSLTPTFVREGKYMKTTAIHVGPS